MDVVISIGCDHSGPGLKRKIISGLAGFVFLDRGCFSVGAVDYPDVAGLVVKDIELGVAKFGILICGTGIGMSIAANRSVHVRAALCYDPSTAKLAREHNDANVVCFGARTMSQDSVLEMCRVFLSTRFCGGRHSARVDKLFRCC